MKTNRPKKLPSRESSRYLRKFSTIILDNVPVSIITIDNRGYITSANRYFKNFSRGGSAKNVNVFSDDFFVRENLAERYRKLLSRGVMFKRDDCYQLNSKGEDKYLNIIAVPFRNRKGEIQGAVSLASDNTDAVKYRNELLQLNISLEERVRQRTEELNKVNQELAKVLELKSVFIADTTHEFRTSLTIMELSLDLLGSACGQNAEDRTLYENVMTEIRRTKNMLVDLALLSTSASSEMALTFEKIDVHALINSVCKGLAVVADTKGVRIEYERNPTRVEIMANQAYLEKLLLNVVRNAIKYNKKGGSVHVSVEVGITGVYLKVADTGIGISEKDIPYIFERFYRVDKTRTGVGEDSGLGLAICKHVAEAHGGSISVISKLRKGSEFRVYLPYHFNTEEVT